MLNKKGLIDVHSHMVLPCYLEALTEEGINPAKEDGFPTPGWTPEEHIEYMNLVGIEKCVLSLSTPHIHHGNGEFSIKTARKINDATAEICKQYPDKFAFAACLPMPEVEASVEEMKRAFDQLGAVAIKVASNSNGIYLGDEVLDPIFEELNTRKGIMIIHPSRPQSLPENTFTAGPAPLFEYISDTTRAVLNMLAKGTLKKYPDVKIIVPHSGSFLPLVIHRMIGISEVLIPRGMMPEVNVKEDFAKLYFDIAGDALPLALDALLKIADPSHVMYGGDFPYTPAPIIARKTNAIIDHLDEMGLAEDILYKNAKNLFGL